MYVTDIRTRVEDGELIEVLTAISVVSKRLARKLTILADQSQHMEGGETKMSKMSEMAASIEELRNAAAAINDVGKLAAEAVSGLMERPKKHPHQIQC